MNKKINRYNSSLSENPYKDRFPMFKVNWFDRIALRIARKRIEKDRYGFVCLAIPGWAFLTSSKIRKQLRSRGIFVLNTIQDIDMFEYYNPMRYVIPMQQHQLRLDWIDLLLGEDK